VNIASPNSSSYTIASAAAGDAGSYSVVATNPSGSATSTAATLTVSAPVSGNSNRLVNISTRSLVGTDDKVQIAGFVIGGTSPKSVLIRASGPALNVSFGLSGYLADPLIELHHSATGDTIASNDNWAASLAPTFTAVGAFPWTTGSNDAALLTSLNPGAYTVIVKGKNNGTGVALVEVYDADVGTPTSKLINISTRSLVGSDDNVQIAGFVIGGSAPKKVVIRASGLALHTSFELSGNLADPLIELHEQATGNLLATADDWDAALAADFAGVGAFPWTAGSKDAALVTTLNPGAYTAMVKGKNNGTGVALIEVYEAN
jgi:hypothetical protein